MPTLRNTERARRLRLLLTEKRKHAGLTQAFVADRLGKPQSFVSKYETGERRVDVVEFLRLADVIGFDPLELLDIVTSISCKPLRPS
jgi:transcriptional regulator with XRE-family HTH domain